MTLLAIPKENTPQKFQVFYVSSCGFEIKLLSLARLVKEHKLPTLNILEVLATNHVANSSKSWTSFWVL